MAVTLPRVASGQLITAAGFNALAAEIEALHLRIDKLPTAVTAAPVVTSPAATANPLKVTDILPHVQFGARSVGDPLELKGVNFGADAAHTRVEVGRALATIDSASATSIKFKIPLPNTARPGTQILRVENLTTGAFDDTAWIWVW